MRALAVTLTLKPDLYRFDIHEQFTRSRTQIQSTLLDSEYEFVAELTAGLNVHWHGILLNTPRNYKRLATLKKCSTIGFLCIKMVRDRAGWIRYMYKDYDKSKILLHPHDPSCKTMPYEQVEQEQRSIAKQGFQFTRSILPNNPKGVGELRRPRGMKAKPEYGKERASTQNIPDSDVTEI